MNKYFLCLSCCVFFLFSFNKCAFALSAMDVVKKYCKLDYNGASLSSHTFEEIRILLDWEEDQDGAGWDIADVILGYEIIDNKNNEKMSEITVKYNILGTLDGTGEFVQKKNIDIVNFILVKKNNLWKIQTSGYPRISINTAINHLSELVSIEKDKKRKLILKSSIKELELGLDQ